MIHYFDIHDDLMMKQILAVGSAKVAVDYQPAFIDGEIVTY
jgi:hypothetical protein